MVLFAVVVKGLVVVIVGAPFVIGTATASAIDPGIGVGIKVIVVLETQEPKPSHPCRAHDVAMTAAGVFVVADKVVVSRQPPNQPYLTQEVVGP